MKKKYILHNNNFFKYLITFQKYFTLNLFCTFHLQDKIYTIKTIMKFFCEIYNKPLHYLKNRNKIAKFI